MTQRVYIKNGKLLANQFVPDVAGIKQVMSAIYERIVPYVVQGHIDYLQDRKGQYMPVVFISFFLVDGQQLQVQTVQDGSSLIYLWNKRGCSREDVLNLVRDLADTLYKWSRVQVALGLSNDDETFESLCYKNNFVNVLNEHLLFEKPCYSVFTTEFDKYKVWLQEIENVLVILNQNYVQRVCSLHKPRTYKYVFKVLFTYKYLQFMLDIVCVEGKVTSYVTYLENYRTDKINKILYTMVLSDYTGSELDYNLIQVKLKSSTLFQHKQEVFTFGETCVVMPYMTFKLNNVVDIIKYLNIVTTVYYKGLNANVMQEKKVDKRIKHIGEKVVFDGVLADWYINDNKMYLYKWKPLYSYLGVEFESLRKMIGTPNEKAALCNLLYKDVKILSEGTPYKIIKEKGKEGIIVSCLDFLRLFLFSKYNEVMDIVRQRYNITKGLLSVGPEALEDIAAGVLLRYTKFLSKNAILLILANNRDIAGMLFECMYSRGANSPLRHYFDSLYLANMNVCDVLPDSICKIYRELCNNSEQRVGSYDLEVHTLYKTNTDKAIDIGGVDKIKRGFLDIGNFIMYSQSLAQFGEPEGGSLVDLDSDNMIVLLLETLEDFNKEAAVV